VHPVVGVGGAQPVDLEAIQAIADRDPRGTAAPEVSVKMDTAGIQARRIVQRWMDRETP